MKDLYSGLEAWQYITDSDSRHDSVDSYLPLFLSAAGGLGVFPFMVLRYMQGAWVAAIVDTVIVLGFALLGTHVYLTRRVRFASIAISVICTLGVITTVYVTGPHQVYWVYPGLMAVFYLLRPPEALIFALVTVAALVPHLYGQIDTHSMTTILVTFGMMSAFAFAFSFVMSRQRERLMMLATKDPLTGAGNRRYFDNRLTHLVKVKKRSEVPASMLLLDIDHFKTVNDVHGHAIGDRILKRVTEIINLRIRSTDTLYRIGGEEFVVVLEDQDIERAVHLAEQLRTLVEANELIPDQSVTISLGVAEYRPDESGVSWLQRADKALYDAKRAGRNTSYIAD